MTFTGGKNPSRIIDHAPVAPLCCSDPIQGIRRSLMVLKGLDGLSVIKWPLIGAHHDTYVALNNEILKKNNDMETF